MTTLPNSVLNKSRLDKFTLVLTLPPVMKDTNSKTWSTRSVDLVSLDKLQFSIWGTIVPPISIPAHGLGVQGQTYHVTSQTRTPYPPINVNFTVDNKFDNYWVLWKWMWYLNHPIDSGMDEHFAEYEPGAGTKPGKPDLTRRAGLTVANALLKKETDSDTPNLAELNLKPIHMENLFTDYQTIITVFGLDEFNNKVIQFDYYNSFITDLGTITYNYRDPNEMASSFQFVFNQLDVKLLD